MSEPENPQAFPLRARSNGSILERSHEGMTLRDWFAGQALSGMLADSTMVRAIGVVGRESGRDDGYVTAETAYEYADAMLRERSK